MKIQIPTRPHSAHFHISEAATRHTEPRDATPEILGHTV